MSRGLGRVQNRCLSAIALCEKRGEPASTFDIIASVYQLDRDADGTLWVTDAQHVAVKRALAGLQREGQVIGFQMYHHERHWYWLSEWRARRWVDEETKRARKHGRATGRIEHVRAKMRAIGMKAG
jgi:hypothetical protein